MLFIPQLLNSIRTRLVFAGIVLGLLTMLLAAPDTFGNEPAQLQTKPNILEVFVRDGCPHCAEAKAFLPKFASERPWLTITYRPVDTDADAREALIHYSRTSGTWPPGVPTFVFNNQVLAGFESPERSGSKLAALVDSGLVKNESIDTGLFGKISVSSMGLPLFTLAIGLLDGFNPCAMWVLLFLLSMLVHLKSRARMALIAGTFVLVSGAVYYAFIATWLNVFLLVGMSKAIHYAIASIAILIGAINIKDYFGVNNGFSLSIPASAKPGLYARMRATVISDSLLISLATAATLAIVVNFVELLCTAGFPAVYTSILAQHHLTSAEHYAYLGLYILGYMADDALMVGTAVMALSSQKLTERAGQWLKLLSGVVMLLLGAVMLLKPEWLL
jgi:glutaredoxin